MASTDTRKGRPGPTPEEQPATRDAGAAPDSPMADMLGGGPESIPPHTPDPTFTLGGGIADAQALGDLSAGSMPNDVATDQQVGSQPAERSTGDGQPRTGRGSRRRPRR